MAEQSLQVFLSASSSNHELADLVGSILKQAGIAVSGGTEFPRVGEQLGDLLIDEMVESDVVVFLVTPNAVRSSYLPVEVGMARALGKPILVLHEGLQKNDLPAYLAPFRIAGVSEVAEVVKSLPELTKAAAG